MWTLINNWNCFLKNYRHYYYSRYPLRTMDVPNRFLIFGSIFCCNFWISKISRKKRKRITPKKPRLFCPRKLRLFLQYLEGTGKASLLHPAAAVAGQGHPSEHHRRVSETAAEAVDWSGGGDGRHERDGTTAAQEARPSRSRAKRGGAGGGGQAWQGTGKRGHCRHCLSKGVVVFIKSAAARTRYGYGKWGGGGKRERYFLLHF